MKAARYSEYGGPEVIKIEEIPTPSIKPDQVLVKNYAASINPFDFKVRQGLVPGMPSGFPITIGGDFSGKILEVGSEVRNYKPDDEIYGQASVFGGASGSMAEFIAANPRSFARKPSNLDFTEASSLPLVGISAVQALHDHMDLKEGQKILVNGGSGGIGSIAVQIAKSIGAYVATTVSTENVDFANSLNADIVIDYKKEKLSLSDYDAVFDTSGKEVNESLLGVLKRGGVLVSMTSKASRELGEKYGVKIVSQNSETTTERLDRLSRYVESGVVKPQVEKVFELDDVVKAYAYQENSKSHGKVVVKIN